MKKFAIIGLVLAGVAAPAAQAGQVDDYGNSPNGIRHVGQLVAPAVRASHRPQLKAPIFQKGKNVTLRGPQVFKNTVTVWVRDPATGKVTAIPYGKWRTEDGR